MQGHKIEATREQLAEMKTAGMSNREIATILGCNEDTVCRHVGQVFASADDRFGDALAGRRFEDVRLKPAVRVFPAYRPFSHDTSLTGCAAALACV